MTELDAAMEMGVEGCVFKALGSTYEVRRAELKKKPTQCAHALTHTRTRTHTSPGGIIR